MTDIRKKMAAELRYMYGDNLSELNQFDVDADHLLESEVIALIRAEAWDEGGMAALLRRDGDAYMNPYRKKAPGGDS